MNYTKDEFLKAAELGEVSMIDANHIVSLLDEIVQKKIKITLHEYAYHCGDGCCFNYGTITTVNDSQLECHNQDAETIVRQILEHLGYSVEIETTHDNE